LNTLLCANNPGSLAWFEAVRDAWPADSPEPLWRDGCHDTADSALQRWRSQSSDICHRDQTPRLFGAISRATVTHTLALLMADPLSPRVFAAQNESGDTITPQTEARTPGSQNALIYLVRDSALPK
jgi:hypothetical protein